MSRKAMITLSKTSLIILICIVAFVVSIGILYPQDVFVPPQEKNRIKRVIGDLSLDSTQVIIESAYWDAYDSSSITLDDTTDKLIRKYIFTDSTLDTISCAVIIPNYFDSFIGFGIGGIINSESGIYRFTLKWNKIVLGDSISIYHSFPDSQSVSYIITGDSLSYVNSMTFLKSSDVVNLDSSYPVIMQFTFTRNTNYTDDTAIGNFDLLYISLVFKRS